MNTALTDLAVSLFTTVINPVVFVHTSATDRVVFPHTVNIYLVASLHMYRYTNPVAFLNKAETNP